MEKKSLSPSKIVLGGNFAILDIKNDEIIIESNYSEIYIFGVLKDRNQPIHQRDPYFRCLAPHGRKVNKPTKC
jgi:hypothetical protein